MEPEQRHFCCFSEAIREGAKLRPQYFGAGMNLEKTKTCAYVAGIEAITGNLITSFDPLAAFPYLGEVKAHCPSAPCAFDHPMSLSGVIFHLNDWIDEAGEGQTKDLSELWQRIVGEIVFSDRVVLYAEREDFPLKGALIEVGIALGLHLPITVCLPGVELDPRSCRPIGSWINHPLVTRCDDIDQALGFVRTAVA